MDALSGKNIVITGASSGIGKALAKEAAAVGANVVLAARSIVKLHQLKKKLSSDSNKIIAIECDVTQPTDCTHLVKQSVEQLGSIDVLINNAGISMRAAFEEVKLDVLREVMNVNYWGTVYCSKAALPHLVASKGSLVAVSSVVGFKGLPGRSAYSSSKFAIHGLFESIRMEYLKSGLHVLIACPGFTASNIRKNALNAEGLAQDETPRDETKMDDPHLVAQQILQAIRERKDFMLKNRQGKLIYYLNKFFPKWLERKIAKEMSLEPNSPIQKINERYTNH
jgi:short-subunit dehydrogenase